MAEFRNMMDSDEDSAEDMDHIPKTPGPPVVSDKESDKDSEEDKSDVERDDEEVKDDNKSDNESDIKHNDNVSDSESDSSSGQSDSSVDNKQSRNDSEVERSDNEDEDNEEQDNEKEVSKEEELVKETNDDVSSDENEDIVDKTGTESQDNEDSDDEEVQRRVSPKKKRPLPEDTDSSDGESGKELKRQKKESVDNEDNEDKDEEMADKGAKAQDIFGEMSSEDEEDNEKEKDGHKDDDEDRDSDKQSVNENNDRKDEESGDEDNVIRGDSAMNEQPFIEDEEQAEEPIPETRIEVEIPRIVADLGREVHFVKLPNFLSIDTHPYDPQWYEDEIDEDENLDDEGRARLKLKVENTIRWRNVVDRETHELKKESNTRVVRWSDGTFSLHLGEEIFDIHKLQLMTGDNNHLFIRQGTGLQGQTVFRTKLNFRPFSTESFTHRKLTLSLADRSQKTQKIRVLPNVGKDPEAHRTEMIKKEEDRLKASIRRENKQRRVRERSLIRGPTASYLEPDGDEDEEEDGISIAKIKNQFKRGSFTKSYDEPEESAEESKQAIDEDSDDDMFDKKEKKRRAAHIDESDDE